MTADTAITVLIPAYKAQDTIARALASVRAQSHAPQQILIIDDGSPVPLRLSPDMHGAIACTLVRLDRNGGSSAALNAGLDRIDTGWTAFLDADDAWHPDKLARQVAQLRRTPDAKLVATGLRFLDEQGRTMMNVATTPLPADPVARLASLIEDCVIGKPTVLARTDVLRAAGGFRTDLIVGEDQDMWLRIAAQHLVGLVPDILTHAHDTAGSLTKRSDLPADYLWQCVIRPIFETHRHKFSTTQQRRIVGARTQQAATSHLARGSYARALRYLLQSSLNGWQPWQNLHFALTACPPLQPLKRLLRGGR